MKKQKFELELRMSNDGIICNANLLKEMLPAKLKKYNYVVTENNYADAKEDRAKLNNLVTALETNRKQFEDAELEDWRSAKQVIMDMEKLIKEVSNALGEGIKGIDEKAKVEKMEEVEKSYIIVAQSMPVEVAFKTMYDRKKYDPKAMTVKKIEEDMQLKINKVLQDWSLLEGYLPTDLADLEQVKQVYATTLDVGIAKAKADDLKAIRESVTQKVARVEATETPQLPKTSKQEHETKPLRQRKVVEFIAERPFYDAMNVLLAEHRKRSKVEVRVIEKEDI